MCLRTVSAEIIWEDPRNIEQVSFEQKIIPIDSWVVEIFEGDNISEDDYVRGLSTNDRIYMEIHFSKMWQVAQVIFYSQTLVFWILNIKLGEYNPINDPTLLVSWLSH